MSPGHPARSRQLFCMSWGPDFGCPGGVQGRLPPPGAPAAPGGGDFSRWQRDCHLAASPLSCGLLKRLLQRERGGCQQHDRTLAGGYRRCRRRPRSKRSRRGLRRPTVRTPSRAVPCSSDPLENTACVAKTPPLSCVPTAFVAETLPSRSSTKRCLQFRIPFDSRDSQRIVVPPPQRCRPRRTTGNYPRRDFCHLACTPTLPPAGVSIEPMRGAQQSDSLAHPYLTQGVPWPAGPEDERGAADGRQADQAGRAEAGRGEGAGAAHGPAGGERGPRPRGPAARPVGSPCCSCNAMAGCCRPRPPGPSRRFSPAPTTTCALGRPRSAPAPWG